jgi:DNA-binding protein HU-beta
MRMPPRLMNTVVSNQYERGGNMNKNELVAAVAEKAGLSKTDASSAVDAVFETIQGELKNGGDIRLVGFGNFSVSRREASKGRNPSTGAEVDIPARNVPKFTAGKGLKDAVN